MTFDKALIEAAEAALAACRRAGLRIATAESCTGGLIAACLTEIPGASDVVECGFVTYSNEAKTELLGVPAALIERHGAVSEQVARAMVEGALGRSRAGLAVAVTGIAGPGGATASKPVGLVHMGTARRGGAVTHQRLVFPGSRETIRRAAVAVALRAIVEQAGSM